MGWNTLQLTSVPKVLVEQPLIGNAVNRATGRSSLFDFDILRLLDICGELISPLLFIVSRKSKPSDGE